MSKIMIWIVTVVGLLPVGFLSIETLRYHSLFARAQRESTPPGSVSQISSASIEFGPSIAKLRLSPKTWPAAVTLCGVIIVICGTFFLFPANPQRLCPNGLSAVGHYLESILQSPKDYASVIVSKPDGSYTVLVARHGRRALVSVWSDATMGNTSELRTKIANFFTSHGVVASSPLASESKGTEDNLLYFEFTLGADPKGSANVMKSLFRDIFGVDDSTGLQFTPTGI